MIGTRKVMVALWVLLLMSAASAYAQEQRCKELGANCVCSEPFNTPTLDHKPNSPYWYFHDSRKECAVEGAAGAAIARNVPDLFMTNDRAIVGRLTSAPLYVVRGPEGQGSLWYVGHDVNDATRFLKRMAFRWYVYYSPNFQFTHEGFCTNGKLVQMGTTTGIAAIMSPTPGIQMYNFHNWPPLNSDCCWVGPSFGDHGPSTYDEWRGRWWRLEIVVTNRQGGPSPNGVRVQLYLKNVTDNAAERLVIDTYGSDYAGAYPYVPHDDFTFPSPLALMRASLFRETRTPGTVCNGYNALSHYMLAGWDTDQGQRIGAAVEIEGLVGDQSPAAPPTGLKLSSLLSRLKSLLK